MALSRDPRDERIAELEEALRQRDLIIAELRNELAALKRQLNQNSSNSSRPPSSDPPAIKNVRNENRRVRRGKRKRGGQKGHEPHQRGLFPIEQCDQVHEHFPDRCCGCNKRLPKISSGDPLRHQVTELPSIKPRIEEHQLHAVTCPNCDAVTRAKLPTGISPSAFGPVLTAIMVMLTGAYRLSRRKVQKLCDELFDVQISIGAISQCERRVSERVAPAVEEAYEHVLDQKVKHTDATTWRRAGKTLQLWTLATAMVTVFRITSDGRAPTVKGLWQKLKGILISDRARVFGFWTMKRRQICWAHLIRKFISFTESGSTIAWALGGELLDETERLFRWWHRVRDGTMTRVRFQQNMRSVRRRIEQLLDVAMRTGITGLAGSCADILDHREALWTFVDTAGVDPTNNHAERELRQLVLWRKTSFGSQSVRGDRFAERIATVTCTLRKQRRNLLEYLTSVCQGALVDRQAPSLLPS